MIVAPVIRLNDFASCVADGDLDARLDVKSRDETRRLANSLNVMVRKLNEEIRSAGEQAEIAGQSVNSMDEAQRAVEIPGHAGPEALKADRGHAEGLRLASYADFAKLAPCKRMKNYALQLKQRNAALFKKFGLVFVLRNMLHSELATRPLG